MGWFDSQQQPQAPQAGSLSALGGGLNTPQPVPGMPPIQFDPSKLTDQYKNDWTPRNPDGTLMTGGITTDQGMPGGENGRGPGGPNAPLNDQDYTNTINRMRELQQDDWRYPTPIAGPNLNDPRRNEMNVLQQRLIQGSGSRNWQQELYPNMGRSFNDLIGGNRGSGQPLNQPMGGFGSLQSLGMDPSAVLRGAQGAQQIGQMINLRGPDGSHKAVPMDQAAHWISKGAVRF